MARTKARQVAKSRTATSATILGTGSFVTGVRGMAGDDTVLLTGNSVVGSVQSAMLYVGPISPTDSSGVYTLTPQFKGETVTGATFYGPDTPLFNPKILKGNVRAVGSYLIEGGEAHNHGMLYEGPPSGGGKWTRLDVPSSAVKGKTVWNTIAHSTMGDLVVGNYDLKGVPFSGNAFLYNIVTRRWTIFDFPGASLTTAYGIWQIQPGKPHYVIVGGMRDGQGLNSGMIVNYNALTGKFSDLTLYSALNVPRLVTHFEGITAAPHGYHLAALTIADQALFVSVAVNGDGAFGAAEWVPYRYPDSTTDKTIITTGNTVYRNTMMGIYVQGGIVYSYAATFK
jgi:hypothetical protein